MLNEVRVGNIDDIEKLLKARFVHEYDENYPKYVLHMYTENERNEVVLNDLPCELYAINANDRIPAAQNQKQTNTGGLVNLLKL